MAEANEILQGPGLSAVLKELARTDPDRIYLRDRQRSITVAELDNRVDQAAARLSDLDVGASSRVGIALPVEIDHVVLIFALLRLGALWIPLNTQIKGEPLFHQLRDSGATDIVAETAGQLMEQLPDVTATAVLVLHEGTGSALTVASLKAQGTDHDEENDQNTRMNACLLMYTSGTTGPPKGVLVSETMLKGAVLGAIEVTTPRPEDVFYVWEPLFHIGGAQVVFIPLFVKTVLALVPKFSASRFWDDIVEFDVTHIHYLGGVLQILLQLPTTEAERNNRVRVAWGAGATPEVRAACRRRYKFALHECYGMTETSSIVTANRDDGDGGVGVPLPWFEIAIDGGSSEANARADDETEAEGSTTLQGEILVKGTVDGLLTDGYLGNAEATTKARAGEWFRTGDFGYLDDRNRLHFTGRGSDSIRVRGENVSAWQIENVFGMHPDVDRCAVVGVDAQVGEQEMLLLVTTAEGREVDPTSILEWGATQLAKFQVPRYVKVIAEMPLTPSQRISKHQLPRDLKTAVQGSQ